MAKMKTGSTKSVTAGKSSASFKGGKNVGGGKSCHSATPIKTVTAGHATFQKKGGKCVGEGTRSFAKKTPPTR